jgi:hypothetical protein
MTNHSTSRHQTRFARVAAQTPSPWVAKASQKRGRIGPQSVGSRTGLARASPCALAVLLRSRTFYILEAEPRSPLRSILESRSYRMIRLRKEAFSCRHNFHYTIRSSACR